MEIIRVHEFLERYGIPGAIHWYNLHTDFYILVWITDKAKFNTVEDFLESNGLSNQIIHKWSHNTIEIFFGNLDNIIIRYHYGSDYGYELITRNQDIILPFILQVGQ